MGTAGGSEDCWLCALQPGASRLTSLCLGVLICEWGALKLSCPTYLTGLL